MKKSWNSFLLTPLLLLAILSLTSCFSLDITMNANKESGTLAIDYAFDDDDFEVLSLVLSTVPGANGEPFDPSVLIDQNEFTSYFNGMNMKELKLKNASIKNSGGKYTGSFAVEFRNLDELLSRFPMAEKGFRFSREGNIRVFEEKLDIQQMGDVETLENYIMLLKEDKPQWYNRFMESSFSIRVASKTPMIETRGVTLSADKKTASYRFQAKDMLGTAKKKLEFLLKF